MELHDYKVKVIKYKVKMSKLSKIKISETGPIPRLDIGSGPNTGICCQGYRNRSDIINHGHEKKLLCIFFIDLYSPR